MIEEVISSGGSCAGEDREVGATEALFPEGELRDKFEGQRPGEEGGGRRSRGS